MRVDLLKSLLKENSFSNLNYFIHQRAMDLVNQILVYQQF